MRNQFSIVGLVTPASVPRGVVNDADDDQVIAAAVTARAVVDTIAARRKT